LCCVSALRSTSQSSKVDEAPHTTASNIEMNSPPLSTDEYDTLERDAAATATVAVETAGDRTQELHSSVVTDVDPSTVADASTIGLSLS